MSLIRRVLAVTFLLFVAASAANKALAADCCDSVCLGCKVVLGVGHCRIGAQFFNCSCDQSSGQCVLGGVCDENCFNGLGEKQACSASQALRRVLGASNALAPRGSSVMPDAETRGRTGGGSAIAHTDRPRSSS